MRLAVLLLLTSCAFSNAMRKGDDLATAGDLNGALSAYEEAQKMKPESARAADAVKETKGKAIQEALNQATFAIQELDFDKGMDQLAFIKKVAPDNMEGQAIAEEAEKTASRELQVALDGNRFEDAYKLAVTTKKYWPTTKLSEPQKAIETCRKHFEEDAAAQTKAKKFEDALTAARKITEFEPDQKPHEQTLEHGILTAWATDLADQAAAAARLNRTGIAAALYARAYEVAGRTEDLEKSRAAVATLTKAASLSLELKTAGSPVRASKVRSSLADKAKTMPQVVSGGSTATLSVALTAGTAHCSEVSTKAKQSKDYVSGQIQVPNPEYGELSDSLNQAEKERTAIASDAAKLKPELDKAKVGLVGFDSQVTSATTARDAAKKKLDQAQAQLDGTRKHQTELQAAIADLTSKNAPESMVTAKQKELDATNSHIDEWQKSVDDAQSALTTAESSLEAIAIDRTPAADALERLNTSYDAIAKQLATAEANSKELKARLASTPKTIWKDVHKTLEYDIVSWTRTCAAPFDARARTAWKTERQTTNSFRPIKTTDDKSNIGNAAAGVQEDPKTYPKSDDALIGEADTETTAALTTWMGDLVQDYYDGWASRTSVALVQDDAQGSNDAITLLLGARSRLNEAGIASFESHLRSKYGISNLQLLGVPAAAPTTASPVPATAEPVPAAP